MPEMKYALLYRRPGDLERVCFGIEYEVINAVVIDLPDIVGCVDEVAASMVSNNIFMRQSRTRLPVFQHLCKQERLLKVGEVSASGCIDIGDGRVTAAHLCSRINGDKGIPSPLPSC